MVRPGQPVKTKKVPPPVGPYPCQSNIAPSELCDLYCASAPPPNFIHKGRPAMTNLNIHEWKKYDYIIHELDPTLIDQLEYGFCMGIDPDSHISIPPTNHRSAIENFHVIDEFIYKHWCTGAIVGPFDSNPLPVPIFPSPLQVATSASGKQRAVIDMSYPSNSSVNDAIPKEWDSMPGFCGEFRLPTHDKLCDRILSLKNPRMALTDLSAYYMQLPSDINDAPYLCFTWRDQIYVHRRLPFGCRASCLHAQRVTEAVCAIHRDRTKGHVDGYVDDFSQIDESELSAGTYSDFHDLLAALGLDRTAHKCLVPGCHRVCLGLMYNLTDRVLELPEDKLARALALIQEWLDFETVSKHKCEQLAGFLNHISAVVHAGRPFSAFLYDLIQSPQFPVVVDDELKADLRMWREFLSTSFTRVSSMKLAVNLPTDICVAIAVKRNTCIVKAADQYHGYAFHASWSIPPPPRHVSSGCLGLSCLSCPPYPRSSRGCLCTHKKGSQNHKQIINRM